MDTAGLGDLILAYAATRKSGGTLKLMRVTKRLQDLLTITKLVSVFDTHDDEAAAVASFSTAAYLARLVASTQRKVGLDRT
jgi:anti-sigma B factor antagonist